MLAGGYAIRAHGLTERPSGDLDLATSARIDLPTIADRLARAFRQSSFDVQLEAIGPPALLDLGPVRTLDDAVGLKVRPLADRALHRDFIDVHAAAVKAGYTWPDLERLGARHSQHWSLAELADRLSAIHLRDDVTFAAYGLTDDEIDELRQWAQSWADDILARLAADTGERPTAAGWDAYLDE
jgi:hypothetical protein